MNSPGTAMADEVGDFPCIKIAPGWLDEGKQGKVLAGPIRDAKGQDWMVVQWDGEDDPDLHKANGLMTRAELWKRVYTA